jgi:hypothetical protein
MTVAQTILDQLGGRRFLAMTGAKDLVGSENSLAMRVPGARKLNMVRVTLTGADDYTVETMKYRSLTVAPVATETGIYAEELRSSFERMTGLYTSL